VHGAPSRAPHAQVVHEIVGALTTIRAVAQLHGKTTSFVDGVVVSVGTRRLLFFLTMQAFRLAVASLLCYGGAYFIGNSIKLGELILNCISLEVRSSFRQAVRGCCVRAHQVHVGRWYARWDSSSLTAWFVRAKSTSVASICSAGKSARTLCGTDARYPGAMRLIISMRGGVRTLAIVYSLCWKSTSSSSQASRREGSSVRSPSRRSS
jgi:hypothetical protein